jgi:hypothetical protein|nr:MAG TPA: hypothetical protein [Caudoviricetes sp.]
MPVFCRENIFKNFDFVLDILYHIWYIYINKRGAAQEVNEMNDIQMIMAMANGEIPTGSETIAEKTFTTNDGEYSATASISVLHEVFEDGHLGEIVNGGCDVTTSGGVVYAAQTYYEAIKMAEELVTHWNDGDYNWEPKKAQW